MEISEKTGDEFTYSKALDFDRVLRLDDREAASTTLCVVSPGRRRYNGFSAACIESGEDIHDKMCTNQKQRAGDKPEIRKIQTEHKRTLTSGSRGLC